MENRIVPFGKYDTVAIERWLSELAMKEGLILAMCHGVKAEFQQENSQLIHYRLIPARTDMAGRLEPETEGQFLAAGWEYVTDIKPFHVVRNTSLHPKPLPFSPEEEKERYAAYLKKEGRDVLLHFALIALIISWEGFILWRKIEDVILGNAAYHLITVLVLIAVSLVGVIDAGHNKQVLQRKLERKEWDMDIDGGLGDDTGLSGGKRKNVMWILVIGCVWMCILLFITNRESDRATLLKDDTASSLPYLDLEEMENASAKGADSTVEYKASLLAPVQYIIKQTAVSGWSNEGVWLDIQYAQTRHPIFADAVLYGMVRELKEEEEYPPYGLQEMTAPGLDEVWFVERSWNESLYMKKDDCIMVVDYIGDLDIRLYLDAFAGLLETRYTAK